MKMSGAGEAHSNEEPVEVIVQVRADVADALRGDALSSREARDLLAAAEEAGVTLTPVHPEADDAVSASYYRFDARDLDDAARRRDASCHERGRSRVPETPRCFSVGRAPRPF